MSPVTAQPPFVSAFMKASSSFAPALFRQSASGERLWSSAFCKHFALAYSAVPTALYLLAAHFWPRLGLASTGVASTAAIRAATANGLLGIDMIMVLPPEGARDATHVSVHRTRSGRPGFVSRGGQPPCAGRGKPVGGRRGPGREALSA